MEYIGLVNLVQYGTPIILLGLMFLNIYQAVIIRQLQDDIHKLKSGITRGDTCNERHRRIDERLDRLEKKVFNGERA